MTTVGIGQARSKSLGQARQWSARGSSGDLASRSEPARSVMSRGCECMTQLLCYACILGAALRDIAS